MCVCLLVPVLSSVPLSLSLGPCVSITEFLFFYTLVCGLRLSLRPCVSSTRSGFVLVPVSLCLSLCLRLSVGLFV